MLDALSAICTRYGVAVVYVFGSRAAEIFGRVRAVSAEVRHPDSDVDLGILPLPGTELDAGQRAIDG